MTKLFVICGHGAGDPGAVGNGYKEYERVRVLGKRIKELGGDNVKLADVNRNYYADNGISSLTISKDYQIIELHMDSTDNTAARGAHVIIRAGLKPDAYDKDLATFLCAVFPGRSEQIVSRDDLANPDRALKMGYSYRLVECGFISNADDVKLFNNSIDKIAKGILKCFDITPVEPKTKPTHKYSTGTLFNCTGLWTQSNGGNWYPANQLLHGKGSYTIGKVHVGAEHPYEAIKNGSVVGFANDKCIDDEPSAPKLKTVEQVANEILNKPNYGGWGEGTARKQKLTAYGGTEFANAVQNRINRLIG